MLYSTPLACMWGISLFFGWLGFSIARKMDAGYVVEDAFSKTVKVTVIRAGERWVPWLGIGAVLLLLLLLVMMIELSIIYLLDCGDY
ncbi:hypothetical protein I7I50_08037 [Histoplasma capsulatum G186AR]|uniref:Uncharacterized protein n=1 Tax=Ajellomyces capsulatus TaxID=5037 RepID=A0A8H7YGX9_AJECA|nr:hypothetical protein I7I52_08553 [Histoplasma capsulatum]QSS68580.1 hypothetical protein I7I50_08037 [Histoplasma capsulatum G186AR]